MIQEFREYIAEIIISIAFSIMPKSETKQSFSNWIFNDCLEKINKRNHASK